MRRLEQLENAQRARSNFSSPFAPPPPVLSPRMEQLASPRGTPNHALNLESFVARTDVHGDALNRFQMTQRGPDAFPHLAEGSTAHATPRRTAGASVPLGGTRPWAGTTWLPPAQAGGKGGGTGTGTGGKAAPSRSVGSSPRERFFSPRNIAVDPAAAASAAARGSSAFADATRSPRGPGKGAGAATNGQTGGTTLSPWAPPPPFSPLWARSELTTAAVDTRTLDAANGMQGNSYGRPTVRVVSYRLGTSDSPRGCPPGRPPRTAPAPVSRRVNLGSPRAQAEGERGADRWISPRVVPSSSPMAVPEHPGLS